MAGLGAAIGGFAQGFGQGLKIRSDLEDAKANREYRGIQTAEAKDRMDRAKQLDTLNNQLFEESKAWRSSSGDYSQFQDPGSDEAAAFHYNRVQPLLEQQARLTGKSELEVRNAVQALEKDRFAQRTFRAAQMIEAGDTAGIDILKPAYNRTFLDGRTLESGTYNRDKDTFTLNYKDKQGNSQSHEVKRDVLVNQYVLGAMNTGDAAKLWMKNREEQRDREFKAGENEKDRGLKTDLNTADNKAAMERTRVSAGATVRAAELNVESRVNARANAREDKDYDDFQAQINDSLGWNKNNPLVTQDQLAARNRDAAAMTGIFNTTREVAGKKLSAYEASQVLKGIQNKSAKFSEDKGYTIVDVGGIRAVLPPQK